MATRKNTAATDKSRPSSSTNEDAIDTLRRLVEHLQELNRWQNNLLAEALHRLTDLTTSPGPQRPRKKKSHTRKNKS